jgi:hypothetical protein
MKRIILTALFPLLTPFIAYGQGQSVGVPELNERVIILEQTLSGLTANLAAEKTAREAADMALQAAINNLTAQSTSTLSQIASLQTAINGQASQIATLSTVVVTLQNQINASGLDIYVSGTGHNIPSSGDDGGQIRLVGLAGLDINALTVPAGDYFLIATPSLYNGDFDNQSATCELRANGTTLVTVDEYVPAVTDYYAPMSDKISLPNGGVVTVRCGGFKLYARPSSRLTAIKVGRVFGFP